MTNQQYRDPDSFSIEKEIIRNEWDLPILELAVRHFGKPLSYFGLPGPAIQDILAWEPLLSIKTGVERLRIGSSDYDQDRERIRRLMKNVMVNDIEHFQLLRGEIEDVICDTTDIDGNVPLLSDGRPPHLMRFHYSLVNLDFLGGVGYRNKHEDSRQVRAVKKLFERQQGTHFILLITWNVRDGMGGELVSYLEQTCTRVEQPLRQIVAWYAARKGGEKEYVLKAIVPLFIQRIAEDNMFHTYAYPPIAYSGKGRARMVHFAFRLTHTRGNFQAFSNQSTEDLLNLPLMQVVNETLRIAEKQHQGFLFDRCRHSLDFLSPEVRTPILETLPVSTDAS